MVQNMMLLQYDGSKDDLDWIAYTIRLSENVYTMKFDMNFKRQPLNRNIAKNQIKSRVSFMRIILIWLFLPEMTLELL